METTSVFRGFADRSDSCWYPPKATFLMTYELAGKHRKTEKASLPRPEVLPEALSRRPWIFHTKYILETHSCDLLGALDVSPVSHRTSQSVEVETPAPASRRSSADNTAPWVAMSHHFQRGFVTMLHYWQANKWKETCQIFHFLLPI